VAALAWLEGGTWIGEGKWPAGSALPVEARYFEREAPARTLSASADF
jgi:hypothetical protein